MGLSKVLNQAHRNEEKLNVSFDNNNENFNISSELILGWTKVNIIIWPTVARRWLQVDVKQRKLKKCADVAGILWI